MVFAESAPHPARLAGVSDLSTTIDVHTLGLGLNAVIYSASLIAANALLPLHKKVTPAIASSAKAIMDLREKFFIVWVVEK